MAWMGETWGHVTVPEVSSMGDGPDENRTFHSVTGKKNKEGTYNDRKHRGDHRCRGAVHSGVPGHRLKTSKPSGAASLGGDDQNWTFHSDIGKKKLLEGSLGSVNIWWLPSERGEIGYFRGVAPGGGGGGKNSLRVRKLKSRVQIEEMVNNVVHTPTNPKWIASDLFCHKCCTLPTSPGLLPVLFRLGALLNETPFSRLAQSTHHH